ncbi:MAG: D-alanine--D-alanine ligase [Erysipelotrichaceae bacterium]|nr:D-alanine--D-alanine ligase [Erysipelotrichaceae bacterium]
MKVLLVCGGQSTEHLVSRMSCTNIAKSLDQSHVFSVLGITKEGVWYELSKDITRFEADNWLEGAQVINNEFTFLKSFDVVFPVLHGRFGEDGTIQGLFEMAGVPYAGCHVLDSAAAMDKIYAKKLWQMAGIKQVKSLYVKKRFDGEFVVVRDNTDEDRDVAGIIAREIGLPCFIKASRSGSSVGCYKVNDEKDIMPMVKEAGQYDKKIVVEEAIEAIELECAVLGNDDVIASRVGQILPHGEFYTYESKYQDEESATCIPARVPQDVQDYIRETAVKAFKAVDGHGLARCDFFLDKVTGEVYLNEINTLPGFTNISMYPQLMADAGINTTELINRLLTLGQE